MDLASELFDDDDERALAAALADVERRRGSSTSASKRARETDENEAPPVEGSTTRAVKATRTTLGDDDARSLGDDDARLLETLERRTGLTKFRPGQLDVVREASRGRDCCVYWSTGSGKSLPYQMVAYSSGKTTVVVSPLISLMQDQVTALNNTVGRGEREVAVFLGSAQIDARADARALEGAYEIVYCTPEKLTANDSFLNGLRRMADAGKIGLFAIDEAHCISAWGHDFRESYSQLSVLRERVPSVPIMALTATAVRFVREDIAKILRLNDPFVSSNSVDRPNLHIDVQRRTDFGRDLDVICKHILSLEDKRVLPSIVYCATIAEVVRVAGALQNRLGERNVRMYHGQMSPPDRKDAHMAFLTSKSPCIVATTAFGMGIDKPDVRFIGHFGAPKTMEEYYQQIGRAGRDGLRSKVTLLFADHEFSRYSSEFYTKDLKTVEARDAQLKSTNALKTYALDRETCRRVMILNHFGEKAPFARCGGTCDNCTRVERGGEENARRDLAKECRPIFLALRYVGSQPTSKLLDYVMGKDPKTGRKLQPWQRDAILAARKSLPPACATKDFCKEMLSLLSREKILFEKIVKGAHATYPVYDLTPAAVSFLQDPPPQLMLLAPESVVAAERARAQKVEEVKKTLHAGGVDISCIPQHELAVGHGEMIDAELDWMRRLEASRGTPRHDALVDLLAKIENWRDERAQQLGMAPAAVLSASLCKKIAYSQPRSVEALRAVGVRVTGVETLSDIIAAATPTAEPTPEASGDVLSFGTIANPQRWDLAEYKPKKGPGGTMKKPNWEVSYDAFQLSGEHIEAIAVRAQPKSIQPATVFNHLLEALTHGRTLDYDRAIASIPPSHRLTRADVTTFSDRQRLRRLPDPRVDRAPPQRAYLDGVVRDSPPSGKSETERAADAAWFAKIRAFFALRRAGVV